MRDAQGLNLSRVTRYVSRITKYKKQEIPVEKYFTERGS